MGARPTNGEPRDSRAGKRGAVRSQRSGARSVAPHGLRAAYAATTTAIKTTRGATMGHMYAPLPFGLRSRREVLGLVSRAAALARGVLPAVSPEVG